MYDPQDYYFKKAKQQGFKARSAFKLDEINEKFHLLDRKTSTVLDIGCAPGSWMQYTYAQLQKLHHSSSLVPRPSPLIIGFDIKKVDLNIPGIFTYVQDVTDHEAVEKIFKQHKISQFDFIQSDMAPNTMGIKDFDAIRSIGLLEQTLRIYKTYLKPNGKFAIKIFMGPGFDEFVLDLKKTFGGKNIKIFKPKACRDESKETYIIKV